MSDAMGVMLYVSDLKASTEFFRDVLGFEFTGYWDDATQSVVQSWDEADEPGYAEVAWQGAEVGIHPDPDFESGPTTIKAYFYTDDVDGIWERVRQTDAEATEPQDFPWGARMFTVTTPDGHQIDFLEEL
jgi:lactoylglutathione lyase